MLTAMLTRIAEFGFSPNKVAALGLNLLLLVHLGVSACAAPGSCADGGRSPSSTGGRPGTCRSTRSGPLVVVVFPPVFGFA